MSRSLVVEDDGDVRDVIVAMLEGQGYQVVQAEGGARMREILAAGGEPFHAIVLDAIMPGESGAILAKHAAALRLPVVMMSGNPQAMRFAHDGYLQLLEKPFSMTALLDAVRAAIASGEFGQRDAPA